MPDADPRRLIVDGVAAAALMQVATIGDGGFPAVCQVWFQVEFEPDRLYFLSREDREHAANIRSDPRVAASIALEVPNRLGERVRGVSLSGLAREVPEADLPRAAKAFVDRWPGAAHLLPQASQAFPPAATATSPASAPVSPPVAPVQPPVPRPAGPSPSPRSRLYEITVTRWVLFDEVNFPSQPRLAVRAH